MIVLAQLTWAARTPAGEGEGPFRQRRASGEEVLADYGERYATVIRRTSLDLDFDPANPQLKVLERLNVLDLAWEMRTRTSGDRDRDDV